MGKSQVELNREYRARLRADRAEVINLRARVAYLESLLAETKLKRAKQAVADTKERLQAEKMKEPLRSWESHGPMPVINQSEEDREYFEPMEPVMEGEMDDEALDRMIADALR